MRYWILAFAMLGSMLFGAAATTSTTATPGCITGDINCDGIVDIRDYGIWRQNFGQTNCGNPADLNDDCLVDIRDYGIWRQHFGETGPVLATATPTIGIPGLPTATNTLVPVPPTSTPTRTAVPTSTNTPSPTPCSPPGVCNHLTKTAEPTRTRTPCPQPNPHC